MLGLSWLGMMVVHEFGHVVGAWTSGGVVRDVDLHPLRFSRTDVDPNPHPLWEVWAGPVIGVTLPIALWGALAWCGDRRAYLFRFFAGSCAVINGAYIGAGWAVEAGDAAELRALGTPVWIMVVFGAACAGGGLWMWNGLARHFGVGTHAEPVSTRHAAGAAAMLILLVIGEWITAGV